jgi:hypothetical protein
LFLSSQGHLACSLEDFQRSVKVLIFLSLMLTHTGPMLYHLPVTVNTQETRALSSACNGKHTGDPCLVIRLQKLTLTHTRPMFYHVFNN